MGVTPYFSISGIWALKWKIASNSQQPDPIFKINTLLEENYEIIVIELK